MPDRIIHSLPKLTYWTSAMHLAASTRRRGHTMHPTKMSTNSLCKVSISIFETHFWSMIPSRNLPIPPKFDSDSNLSDRKHNPREIANLEKDHHQKRCTEPIFGVETHFLIGDPTRRECHSTQNSILHLTQVQSRLTKVEWRIRRKRVEYRANFTNVLSTLAGETFIRLLHVHQCVVLFLHSSL